MPVPGALSRGLGYIDAVLANWGQNAAPVTYAMAALNTGWCGRFMAPDTRDIYSVWIYWASVSAAGTVNLRIETIDTTSGKPTGTLYDANATISFTPVAGWQQLTFAAHPTTGLVAGNEYGLVLLTTVAGTTMTLRSHVAQGHFTTQVLTAANGTVRTNFAGVANATQVATVVFSDSNEEHLGMAPWATATNFAVFGTQAYGAKFVVPTGEVWNIAGVQLGAPLAAGTPGDCRVRILNSSDAQVTGASVALPKNSLAGVTSNLSRVLALFPAVVQLTAGTYRIVVDEPTHATTTGNQWTFYNGATRIAALNSANFIGTTTANVTAGPPITWTDAATDAPLVGLIPDNMSVAAVAQNVGIRSGGRM